MPREIPIFDALVPTLLLAFILSFFVTWCIDTLLTQCNLYAWVWYRAMFRFACFVAVFAAGGLWIY